MADIISPVPADLFELGNRGRWFEDIRRELNGLAVTGGVDHLLLANIGTNTHAQIDTALATALSHRSDATIHFTMLDEDDMATNSNTQTATQQSIKAYVDLRPYVAKTANYTLTVTDETVECTANSFTITLPTSVGIAGKRYNIKNSGTGTITIATTSSQTIDGATTKTITKQYTNVPVKSNGANWMIL